MTTICALDISSFQINACILADDQAPILRTEIIGVKTKDPLVDRLGRIPAAIARITWIVTSTNPDDAHPMLKESWERTGMTPMVGFEKGIYPDWLVVEEPFGGRNMPKALLLTAGACLASTPRGCRPWLITPMDWREAIGSRNTKPAGHEAVARVLGGYVWNDQYGPEWIERLTFDELDAIGIALGARAILERQAAA